jgi:hypothetical protein
VCALLSAVVSVLGEFDRCRDPSDPRATAIACRATATASCCSGGLRALLLLLLLLWVLVAAVVLLLLLRLTERIGAGIAVIVELNAALQYGSGAVFSVV